MEICDVIRDTGRIARICTPDDDFRVKIEWEARKAQALADELMRGDWTRPAQPVHVVRAGEPV